MDVNLSLSLIHLPQYLCLPISCSLAYTLTHNVTESHSLYMYEEYAIIIVPDRKSAIFPHTHTTIQYAFLTYVPGNGNTRVSLKKPLQMVFVHLQGYFHLSTLYKNKFHMLLVDLLANFSESNFSALGAVILVVNSKRNTKETQLKTNLPLLEVIVSQHGQQW